MQSSSYDNCLCHYNFIILNLFDPELQLLNTKAIIKYKLKELINELKKFRVYSILILEYKKRNYHETFESTTKRVASDSETDEAFKSMHQKILMKIKFFDSLDWVV